jgi:CDP-paratose 2-epimerase
MTSNASRRVLITGGAGFIGCNLADRLLRDGQHVTVFDNLSRRGADRNLAWLQQRHGDRLHFINGDIRSPEALQNPIADAGIVFHLASQTAVTTSVLNPRADFEANTLGTFNVLEAIRQAGHFPILLYASTNKVYGGMEDEPVIEGATRYSYRDLPHGVAETQPIDFHSPYGCSKGAADQYVHDYARIYDLPTIVFRQSCIYGPRQMGVEDQGWVAWFLIALLTGRPITIYGNGKQVRDLLYIDDLVEAFVLATASIERTRGQIYNIGGGSENALSVWWELKPILQDALEREIPDPPFAPWRPGDQPIFVADTRKAERDFGWTPRTPVRDGIAKLAAWVQEHRDLFVSVGD